MVTAVNTPALVGTLLRPADWLDPGNKSPATAEDAQAAVVQISAEGAKRAEAAAQAAPAAPQAEDLSARLDGGGAGQVSVQQFKASEPPAPPAGGGASARAQAPADGGGSAVGVSSTPSSSQTYDPADTDQDGQVSPRERQAYEAKLADAKQAQALANSGRAAEVGAAVKAYEAVEQLGAAG